MKALSIRQPFAELIARGTKTIEYRTWQPRYRGPLLICAGSARHPQADVEHGRIGNSGVTVCVVTLVDCVQTEWEFEWILVEPRRVREVPLKGRLGIWAVDDSWIASLALPSVPAVPATASAPTRAEKCLEVPPWADRVTVAPAKTRSSRV